MLTHTYLLHWGSRLIQGTSERAKWSDCSSSCCCWPWLQCRCLQQAASHQRPNVTENQRIRKLILVLILWCRHSTGFVCSHQKTCEDCAVNQLMAFTQCPLRCNGSLTCCRDISTYQLSSNGYNDHCNLYSVHFALEDVLLLLLLSVAAHAMTGCPAESAKLPAACAPGQHWASCPNVAVAAQS